MKKALKFCLIACILISAASVCVWAAGAKDIVKTREVVLGNYWADWNAFTTQFTDDEDFNAFVKWRRDIQTDFKVEEKMIADWGGMLPLITQYVMAGRPPSQAMRVQADWAMTLKRQNLLAALSDSSAVNLKNTAVSPKKFCAYDQNIGSLFTFGGKQYAMAPISGSGITDHEVVIYYNKRLFREAGMDADLPYDLQKSGDWDWERFLDVCKRLTRDTNNDGIKDVYAFPSDPDKLLLDAMAYSNNADFVTRNAAGSFVNATGSANFIEALSFIERMNAEGVIKLRPEGSIYNWYEPEFFDGKLGMIFGAQYYRVNLRSMKDDWGCVMPPKGPKASAYRVAVDDNVIIVPATYKGEALDLILKAVDLWLTPVADNALEQERANYRDARAVSETLAMLGDPKHRAFRTHFLIPGLETGDIAWIMWWMYGDPAQLVESVSQKYDALVADANKMK